jgi:AcrR family transcriptional regulator
MWTYFVNCVFMDEKKKSKILATARTVFLRFGYKRVSMSDIAEASAVSRAALYLVFKNKEDIFVGVYLQWLDETLTEIQAAIAKDVTPEKRIELAFEIWAVRPFEMMVKSPEAKELIECSFGFAQDPIRSGYEKFEATIVPVLASIAKQHSSKARISPEKTAHVLASAVRGFKQAATTPNELRQLIKELLFMSLS